MLWYMGYTRVMQMIKKIDDRRICFLIIVINQKEQY